MAKKIYLSPSNQSGNLYATGSTNEMVQCNKIANAAKTALARCGFSVKKAAQGAAMADAVAESNSYGADLHLPIHTNAYNGSFTGGTMVMVYSLTKENTKAANCILNSVKAITPGNDYSVQSRPELYELKATACTAVYIECEFHDTVKGSDFIINNTSRLGESIAKGVCDYFGVTYKTEEQQKLYRVRKSWNDAESQKGAFADYNNAVKCADKYSGYSVFDYSGKIVYSSATVKKLTLKAVTLYVSAQAKQGSGTVNGTYYLWSGEKVSGRVKITTAPDKIGKQGQVTGWIDAKYAV